MSRCVGMQPCMSPYPATPTSHMKLTGQCVLRLHTLAALLTCLVCCPQFPAGLIDAGETPAQAALRELKEETGYSGTVVEVSPVRPGMHSNLALLCSASLSWLLQDTGGGLAHAYVFMVIMYPDWRLE